MGLLNRGRPTFKIQRRMPNFPNIPSKARDNEYAKHIRNEVRYRPQVYSSSDDALISPGSEHS